MTEQEFRNKFTAGHMGDKLDYKERLNRVADYLYRGVSVETISDDKTLTEEDSNKIFLVGTDAKTITLPATEEGLKYTFVNAGADGGVALTLSPQADDAIYGSIANSAADSVSGGADGMDIVNTKTTANKGDRITLVADGAGGWYIVEGVGIWASET